MEILEITNHVEVLQHISSSHKNVCPIYKDFNNAVKCVDLCNYIRIHHPSLVTPNHNMHSSAKGKVDCRTRKCIKSSSKLIS